jgi:hypothetical protein
MWNPDKWEPDSTVLATLPKRSGVIVDLAIDGDDVIAITDRGLRFRIKTDGAGIVDISSDIASDALN